MKPRLSILLNLGVGLFLLTQAQTIDLGLNEMILSPDLVQFIPDSSVHMLLLEIQTLTPISGTDEELERGNLELEVREVISSDKFKEGQFLNLSYQRASDEQARNLQGFNAWNNVNLNPQALLVMGVKRNEESKTWLAVTGDGVSDAEDPLLIALRRAYRIEHFQGDERRKLNALHHALMNEHTLLRFYAIQVLTERALYKRIDAIKLLKSALKEDGVDEDIRLDLGRALLSSQLYIRSLGDDEANLLIVSEIASQLLKAQGETSRSDWTALLANAVLASFADEEKLDNSIRLTFVRSIKMPSAALVMSALKRQISSQSAEDSLIPQELFEVWRKAHEPSAPADAQ